MSFWSDVSLVASREVRERGRGRTFVVSTVLGIILVVGAIVAASVLRPHDATPAYQIGLVGQVPPELARVVELTGSASGGIVTTRAFPDQASAEAAVKDGSILAALLADGTVLLDKRGNGLLEGLLTAAVQQYERLGQAGLSQAQVDGLLTPAGPVEIRALDQGKTNPESLSVAVIGAVLLMLAMSLYGQWVLLGVLEEKSNRVVELVVAAIPIRRLLAGKVVGIGMLGVGQLVLLLGAGVGAGITLDLLELPRTALATAVWAVVWFLLGYAFYAVLYAAAGSLVSRQADASAAGMPVALGLVAFYLATTTIVFPSPSSTASRVLSFLPPAAPMAVPARVALGAIAPWEIALALALMLAAIYGAIVLAARVYTGALLAYGPRLRWRQAWRSAGDVDL
jgi:ABC-2 type transport system permease protein